MLRSVRRLPALARIRPGICVAAFVHPRYSTTVQVQASEPTIQPFVRDGTAKTRPKSFQSSALRAHEHRDRPRARREDSSPGSSHARVHGQRQSHRKPGPGAESRPHRTTFNPSSKRPENSLSSPNGSTPTARQPKESFVVKKEMEYLTDKVLLSGRVRDLLAADDFNLAVQLAEAGTRRKINTVASWNQILKHLFAQRKVQAALKTYNDMKKRGEKPTSWTYSTIFSGLHRNSQVPTALETALSIFESIKSTEPPSAAYNPVLGLCIAKEDYSSLQKIFDGLPRSGAGKPDHSTYLLVLEGIKSKARSATPETRAQISLQARKVWAEVIQQWKDGQLQMDDYLPSIMAETLLSCGRREDVDDIFSLVEQVFGVTRFSPRLNLTQKEDGSLFTNDMLTALNPDHSFRSSERHHRVEIGDVFEPVSATMVSPTGHVLSALIKAATILRAHEAADYYFTVLRSEPYNVVIHETVWKHYLSHLHYARSGIRAVKAVMEDVPESGMEPTLYMYRRAVTACCRNWRDPETFAAATRVVEHVIENNKPDPAMIESWIEIARKQADAPESEALAKMRLMGPRLRDIVLKNGGSNARVWLGVCSKIVGMYDKVLNSDAIIHWKYRSALQAERLKMSAFVTRLELLHRQQESRGTPRDKTPQRKEKSIGDITAEKEATYVAMKEVVEAARSEEEPRSELDAASITTAQVEHTDPTPHIKASHEDRPSPVLVKAEAAIHQGSAVIAQATEAVQEHLGRKIILETS